ncbi:hypothetical protein R6Z07F_018254 [Ovis aries]
MGSPHRRSGRTGRTPEAASEPEKPAEAGCARRLGAGGWGQADRSEVWDLPSRASTRSQPHPPSQQVGAGPTPAALPWANPRREHAPGRCQAPGPRPALPLALRPAPLPRRPSPALPLRPGRSPGPPGGRRGSATGKEGAAARAACPRPRGRPPAAPGVPASRGAGASPTVGRRARGGGWGSPCPAPPLSFSVPTGRAPGSPGRRCPLVAHFGREREDCRGPRALTGRRFLPGPSPVDRDPHPESARPGDWGRTCLPARDSAQCAAGWAHRDGVICSVGPGLSPVGARWQALSPAFAPLIEDESPQSVLYSVYACSHLEGRWQYEGAVESGLELLIPHPELSSSRDCFSNTHGVHVPSPGYVNEVNSCKLDEEDTLKLKDKQSSEILVHKGDPPSEGCKRTASGSGTASPQEPCGLPRGPRLLGDAVEGPWAEKTSGAVNGVGPAAVLQLSGEPGPPQGARDSWASAANKGHPTQPFPEGGSARELDCMQLASGETQVIGNAGSGAPSTAGLAAWEVPAHVLQTPTPDYPPLCGSAEDNADHVDHQEKDHLFKIHSEKEPQEGAHPPAGECGLNMPFSAKRSWDSLNEAVTTEIPSVYFDKDDPAQDVPVVDSRNGWEEAPGSPGDRSWETVDQDAEVAEALAALEAATAGEDVDEAE